MFQKLLILLSVLLVFSCQNSSVKKDTSDLQPIEQTKTFDPQQENYQTIDNEEQAAALSKQAADQSQEIEVQDRVFFGYDSNSLSDEAKKILDVQTMWLKNDAAVNITVEGHCDERGTREYNIALGERRANAVRSYLVENGIDANRVKTTSYGKERPAFFGNDEKVFSKNRRAVAVIVTSN